MSQLARSAPSPEPIEPSFLVDSRSASPQHLQQIDWGCPWYTAFHRHYLALLSVCSICRAAPFVQGQREPLQLPVGVAPGPGRQVRSWWAVCLGCGMSRHARKHCAHETRATRPCNVFFRLVSGLGPDQPLMPSTVSQHSFKARGSRLLVIRGKPVGGGAVDAGGRECNGQHNSRCEQLTP